MTTYLLIPGNSAALMYVQRLPEGHDETVVFLSVEKEVVYGPHDIPLSKSNLPLRVQADINKHFGIVFSLLPEARERYMKMAVPWTVEVDEELEHAEQLCDAYDKAKFS